MVERGLASTRSQASALIRLGRVRAAGQIVDKPGMLLPIDVPIDVQPGPAYVSRGGMKLETALDRFGIDASQATCLDVGASTGGFTQVLLRRGARRIYAVDVGRAQLDWSLRQDPRVVNMERTDIRSVASLPEPIDIAVVDVSFISLRLVLPPVRRLLSDDALAIVLVKPQFEAGRRAVPKGGVIRESAVHEQVLRHVFEWMTAIGWRIVDAARSSVPGSSGNLEFFALLTLGPGRLSLTPEEATRRSLADVAPTPRAAP